MAPEGLCVCAWQGVTTVSPRVSVIARNLRCFKRGVPRGPIRRPLSYVCGGNHILVPNCARSGARRFFACSRCRDYESKPGDNSQSPKSSSIREQSRYKSAKRGRELASARADIAAARGTGRRRREAPIAVLAAGGQHDSGVANPNAHFRDHNDGRVPLDVHLLSAAGAKEKV